MYVHYFSYLEPAAISCKGEFSLKKPSEKYGM